MTIQRTTAFQKAAIFLPGQQKPGGHEIKSVTVKGKSGKQPQIFHTVRINNPLDASIKGAIPDTPSPASQFWEVDFRTKHGISNENSIAEGFLIPQQNGTSSLSQINFRKLVPTAEGNSLKIDRDSSLATLKYEPPLTVSNDGSITAAAGTRVTYSSNLEH